MKHIFLGYDKRRLTDSFSYITKAHAKNALTALGYEITTSMDGSFDEALILSAEDFLSVYPKLMKMNVPFDVLALSDVDDFQYNKNGILLSQSAYNCYSKARKLWVHYPSEIEFLRKNRIMTPCEFIPPHYVCSDYGTVNETERKAFRSFYQINPERKVIISYGSYQNPNLSEIESVARMNPEYEFLFFGRGEKITLRLMDRLMHAPNIRYLATIPEELYRSALLNASAVLCMKDMIASPYLIFDAIIHEVPIISYQNHVLPELINSSTSVLAPDFLTLYQSIRRLNQLNKAKEAKIILEKQTSSSVNLNKTR